VFTTHLVVDDAASKEEVMRIRQDSQQAIHDLHVEHFTIAVEYESEECAMRNEA
jgi:cobalt-zinc-cadmium efflux system protein